MTEPVLVLGGTGYVGHHILYHLATDPGLGQQLELHATFGRACPDLGESPTTSKDAFARVSWHSLADLADGNALRALFDKIRPSKVINCAANSDVGACERDPEGVPFILNSVPDALLQVLEEAAGANPAFAFIHCSTDQVFQGEPEGHELYGDELPGINLPPPCTAYGKAKLEGERRVTTALPGQHALLRLSVVLGPPPHRGFHHTHSTFVQWLKGALLSQDNPDETLECFANEYRNFVSVKDVCLVVLSLLTLPWGDSRGHPLGKDDHTRPFALNVGGTSLLTRFDLAQAVAQALGLSEDTIRIRVVPKVLSAAERKQLPYPRPPDLGMDSSRVQQISGRKFQSTEEMIAYALDTV